MNTKKGKGKLRPNKSNPNPQQKEEINVENVETVSEEKDSAQKSEERVPEIISEIVPPPVIDVKEKEEDGPKKPNRNRGKKKKHDNDENEAQDQLSENVEGAKLEIIEIETQETATEDATPGSRKKKNKNKKTVDSEAKVIEQSDKKETFEEKKLEGESVSKEDSKPQETGDEEIKTPKKKNKKKKQRNDSERSNAKTDELSCTSAFQKLLVDEKKDTKTVEDIPILAETPLPETPKTKEINISAFIQELEKVEDIDYTAQETKQSSKSKKKNKKEKIDPPKETQSDMITEISLMTAIKPILKDEPVLKDDLKLKESQPTGPSNVLNVDEDVKPKAKIAKPVERKWKGKEDKYTDELSSEIVSTEAATKEETTHESKIEDVIPITDISKQSEVTTASFIPELVNIEETKETAPKPAEKKKKGKGNKQRDELVTDNTQTKDKIIAVPMQQTIMEPESILIKAETKLDTTEDIKLVSSEALEQVTESKQVTEKIGPKAEQKRKGKKDTKIHELPAESTTEDKETKVMEPIPPVSTGEEKSGIAVISKTDEIKDLQDFMTDIISNPVESKLTEESEELKIKEKAPQQKMETTASIPTQCFLRDIPFLPDPIENIQSKQESATDIDIIPSKSESEDLKETSFINPAENVTGKKRKKSPKPPKHDQKPKMSEIKPETTPDTTSAKKEEMRPIKDDTKIKELISTPIMVLPEPELEDDPIIMEPITDISLETEEKIPFETKTNKKKRKKSPKLPRTPEATEIKELTHEKDESKSTPVTLDVTKEDVKESKLQEEKGEVFYDLPSVVEITSLKADESEGTTSGLTPDIIQYPRATSQELTDDNNNMLIQEITLAEEVKLQIPLQMPDTPLIQGSGSTPLEAPDNILVGIRISQPGNSNKTESEKTDIKSKMMEVNQDMEELRLSIERSLAELTAIEKSEDVVEKQFEDRKTISEIVTPTDEMKIKMPSELIANISSELKMKGIEPEKTEIQSPKTIDEKLESQGKKPKKKEKKATLPSDNKLPETNIPPKTSMFFDKELKDTDDQLKPDIIQQQVTNIVDITKIPEKCEVIPPMLIDDIPRMLDNLTDIPPMPPMRKDKSLSKERENKDAKMKPVAEAKPTDATSMADTPKSAEVVSATVAPPVCPARKDNKKGKNKKKGKQEASQEVAQTESTSTPTESKETNKDENAGQKSQSSQEKGKQKSNTADQTKCSDDKEPGSSNAVPVPEFELIENFEDAMTSSADDINKTFEIIANEANRSIEASHVNPEIKIVAPAEDTDKKKDRKDKRDEKINPVSQPKNLLGHPDIPVRLNKTDYKKEKNKTPNAVLAKVKIKDSVEIESKKQSKDTQTDNIKKFMKNKSIDESFSSMSNENDEFVYKYSFRKVFLQSACHICKKELKQARVPCNFCNLLFYCNAKHKDEDWPQHQGFCFAISTIVHLKDQKHIYADAANVAGQDYRLLRMQMIVSCERVLKRRLLAWEQEAVLYPRMCADVSCREWRQGKLQDCDGCGQISYCSNNPAHLPKSHQRWCKSYALYQKLVCYQQTQGRLEPKLPGKVMSEDYRIPEKINEALATMYEEKIDMNDIQYAALTQVATASLTTAYCHQAYASTGQANGTYKKSSCTVHIVGGSLQWEAGALNKWEVFLLHLRPRLQRLHVVMVGADLNPSHLPLDLLGTPKVCDTCRFNERQVVFSFHDKTTYHDYRAGEDFVTPDIVCAFNPSIKRGSMYNGNDPWPKTINSILKQKVPFLVSAYTLTELQRDLARIKECSEVDVKVVIEPKLNSFGSVRPDRNFISDDEMPLLFKNYCYMLVCGVH